MFRPRYSILTILLATALIAVALAAYRYWVTPVYPLNADRYVSRMTTEFPGARIETDLNLELIDDFPVWNRKHSHPPVAAGKAIELADRYRTIELLGHKRLQAVNQSHDWVFQSVELAPLRPGKGVWVWVVNYNLRKTNIWYVEPDPRVVSIVVKMDGGIVEPRIF